MEGVPRSWMEDNKDHMWNHMGNPGASPDLFSWCWIEEIEYLNSGDICDFSL